MEVFRLSLDNQPQCVIALMLGKSEFTLGREVPHGCSTFPDSHPYTGHLWEEPSSGSAAFSHFGIEQSSRNYPNILLYRLNRCQCFCHLGSSKLASAPKKLALKFQIKGNKHFPQLATALMKILIYQNQPICPSEPTSVKSRISQSTD